MIKIFLGGIGSGKSISIVKEIIDSNQIFFTNFKIYGHGNYKRLKISDIIKNEKKKQSVNWNFWQEQIKTVKNFNFAIDELHNIMHSRRSMSKFNVLMSMWIAQIRKVCGSSEKTHFYCISQELERIDIAVRDLAHIIIWCDKIETDELIETKVRENKRIITKMLPKIYIIKYFFIGTSCTKDYINFRDYGSRSYNFKTGFVANDYFKYYDSYELIEFGESDYL